MNGCMWLHNLRQKLKSTFFEEKKNSLHFGVTPFEIFFFQKMLSLAFEATSMALASLNWTILAHCAREKSRNFPMRAAGYTKGQLKEDIAFKEHKFNSTLENSKF